jgi:acetolactate synthase-1/2/3 large subunit
MMDKAIDIATSGRPGPVWLDIPLSVQGAQIDEDNLSEYTKEKTKTTSEAKKYAEETVSALKKAKRPVLFVGRGIRISGAEDILNKIINTLKIPVVTSLNGMDLVPSSNPYYIGHNGTIGQRAGNFTVQNSDLLLSIGSRNNIRQVSYNWGGYARAAKKIIVDIDKAELSKPTIHPDIAVNCDAKEFLEALLMELQKADLPSYSEWLSWCRDKKIKYPTVLPEYNKQKEPVNPYFFIEKMTSKLRDGSIIVGGNGSATVITFQAAIIKNDQRIIINSGCASMGYDIPAAIGASVAKDKGEIICLAGDGSAQMNIQELQTIAGYNLPIKLFYLNNNGYVSIKQTQENFFPGCRIACCPGSGVTLPDMSKLAVAYGLKYVKIEKQNNVDRAVDEVLAEKGPVVCEVMLQDFYIFSPKTSSLKKEDGTMVSKPLEDMYPFLDREEFKKDMIIPPID